MIHETNDGTFVISSRRCWLPGAYENERAAKYAFRFTDSVLYSLQESKNDAQPEGTGGVITFEDLQKARKSS